MTPASLQIVLMKVFFCLADVNWPALSNANTMAKEAMVLGGLPIIGEVRLLVISIAGPLMVISNSKSPMILRVRLQMLSLTIDFSGTICCWTGEGEATCSEVLVEVSLSSKIFSSSSACFASKVLLICLSDALMLFNSTPEKASIYSRLRATKLSLQTLNIAAAVIPSIDLLLKQLDWAESFLIRFWHLF